VSQEASACAVGAGKLFCKVGFVSSFVRLANVLGCEAWRVWLMFLSLQIILVCPNRVAYNGSGICDVGELALQMFNKNYSVSQHIQKLH